MKQEDLYEAFAASACAADGKRWCLLHAPNYKITFNQTFTCTSVHVIYPYILKKQKWLSYFSLT